MLKKISIIIMIFSFIIIGIDINENINNIFVSIFLVGLILLIISLTAKKNVKKENIKKTDNKDDIDEIENVVVHSIEELKQFSNVNSTKKNENRLIEPSLIPPNPNYKCPSLDIISNKKFMDSIKNIPSNGKLMIPIGISESNKWIYSDITKMPNLLIGGTVMSGKTSFINFIISNILMRFKPTEVKFIIADSKKIDYTCYNGVPHLLTNVITDPKKLNIVLQNLVKEMEKRYDFFAEEQVKNISDYNSKIKEKDNISISMPYIIVIIDDYSTFVTYMEDSVNSCIELLTKSGWSAGMHLVMVANHPTANILSAISKSNFPTRLSFRVPSIRDSRTILEAPGAEKITGVGNALINLLGDIKRLSTIEITDEDISKIIHYVCMEQVAQYDMDILKSPNDCITYDGVLGDNYNPDSDPLFNDIVNFCVESGRVSASLLQRRFKLGYNRAARIIDILEERGFIGPANGSKPREVLIKYDDKK